MEAENEKELFERRRFVKQVHRWRRKHGVNQIKAAWFLGVCPRTYNYWEQEKRMPTKAAIEHGRKRFERLSKAHEARHPKV